MAGLHGDKLMKLSIITATYNSESTLERCLDSVACQSRLSDIEHIIIDGKSTDGTLQLAAQYPHIDKICSAKDRGIYDAFNKGVAQATGELIYFLNSDDVLINENIVDFIFSQFNESVMYLSGAVHCIDEDQSFVAREYNPEEPKSKPRHQGFVCRREIFDEIGHFNECLSIAADTYFMKKVVRKYPGICCDKVIAHFHLGGISSQPENFQAVIAQDNIVEYLLGDSKALATNTSEASFHSQNNLYLKALLDAVVSKKLDVSGLKNKTIAIFGVRELSVILYKILSHHDLSVHCFLVSNDAEQADNFNLPCYSLESNLATVPDYVINCVEGPHRSKLSETISKKLPNSKVVDWFRVTQI